MDRRKVVIEHPTVPNRSIIAGLLFRVVVADSKTICKVEEIGLILRSEYLLKLRPEIFEHIGEVADRVAAILQR